MIYIWAMLCLSTPWCEGQEILGYEYTGYAVCEKWFDPAPTENASYVDDARCFDELLQCRTDEDTL